MTSGKDSKGDYTSQAKYLASKEERRNGQRMKRLQQHTTISLEQFDGDVFRELLRSMLLKQGAIRIGTTRDGGAWAIGVYGDGPTPYTEYVKPDESLVEYFADLAAFFDTLP